VRPALVWVAAAALALPGCATIESLFKPEPPAAPAPSTSAPPASTPAPLPSTAAPPPSTPTPPPSSSAPPPRARPVPPPLPPLQPQLTEQEERRLRERAMRQIGDAEQAMRGVRTDALQPAERETLGSIESFLRQAREALEARDYERASTLARKAQALAQDLPQAAR
jgi:hypothetical protein